MVGGVAVVRPLVWLVWPLREKYSAAARRAAGEAVVAFAPGAVDALVTLFELVKLNPDELFWNSVSSAKLALNAIPRAPQMARIHVPRIMLLLLTRNV